MSRAVHASLPISKLVKQQPDFLNSTASQRPVSSSGGGVLNHLVSSVNTLFRVPLSQRRLPGCRRREAGSKPSHSLRQPPFCVSLSAVSAGVVGVGRRFISASHTPVNRLFLNSFFSAIYRRIRSFGRGLCPARIAFGGLLTPEIGPVPVA